MSCFPHSDLELVLWDIDLCGYLIVPAPLIKEKFFSQLFSYTIFVPNYLSMCKGICFWVFCCLLLFYLSISTMITDGQLTFSKHCYLVEQIFYHCSSYMWSIILDMNSITLQNSGVNDKYFHFVSGLKGDYLHHHY